MMNFTPIKRLALVLITVFSLNANAQINVTADDFSKVMALGEKFTTYLDSTTTTINVGAAGQNTWDLSGLVASVEFETENKAVSGSPYETDFPDAEYASYYQGVFAGVQSTTWVYTSVTSSFLTHGTGSVVSAAAGSTKSIIKYTPAWVEYKLPLGFGDENSYSGKQTLTNIVTVPGFGEIPSTIEQDIEVTQHVDGYGVVKFPGGKQLNALRIIEVSRFTYNGVETSSTVIKLLTKTGESAAITPKNEGETSGTISVDNISWTSGSGDGIVAEVPVSPSELAATITDEGISLSWVDNSDNETGFYIERAEDISLFSLIDSVLGGITSYVDANVVAGVQYTYRIKAFNENGGSEYTSTVTATIEPIVVNAPDGLSISINGDAIDLTWADNSDNETGFYIERSENGGEFALIDSTFAGVNMYSDNQIVNDVEYSYRVSAFNLTAISGYSNTETITKTTTGIYDLLDAGNKFSLGQNFPNPFRGKTSISFHIPRNEFVTMKVLNSKGELVKVLISKELPKGEHNFDFNFETFDGGIYFYQLKTTHFVETRSMMIVK